MRDPPHASVRCIRLCKMRLIINAHTHISQRVQKCSDGLSILTILGNQLAQIHTRCQRPDFVGTRVQTYLGHLAQCSSFLSEVDDNSAATILSFLDGLFDTEDEIRPAGADI
jgi:hypothetical protein